MDIKICGRADESIVEALWAYIPSAIARTTIRIGPIMLFIIYAAEPKNALDLFFIRDDIGLFCL